MDDGEYAIDWGLLLFFKLILSIWLLNCYFLFAATTLAIVVLDYNTSLPRLHLPQKVLEAITICSVLQIFHWLFGDTSEVVGWRCMVA